MTTPLLSVSDLRISYRNALRTGVAVDGLSFSIAPGESLALVGESGCGKSTTALSILRLLPRETEIGGSILFEGGDLATMPEGEIEKIRGNEIGIIFQEPQTALNPVYRVGWQIGEVLRRHLKLTAREARERTLELLRVVALPDVERIIDAFPHELSGGQRQRIVIAMAIALKPKLLIADEPTTALDASIRGQILELIDRLRRERNMAVLLISHDLPLVSQWTDRVLIMHHGQAMEKLASRELFRSAKHTYTRGLIGASLRLDGDRRYDRHRLAEISVARQIDGSFDYALRQPDPPAQATVEPKGQGFSVKDLVVCYDGTTAVDGISFDIPKGGTLGIVGESGSGKSTLARAIVGLVRPTSGAISLDGEPLTGLDAAALRPHRKRIQMVFQDPFASLNPRHTVERILDRVLTANGVSNRLEREGRIHKSLDQVGLPRTAAQRYPHEFSGGQRQRIAIARALILRPDFVLCDEPTSALDVSVQAQILNLLADLKQELGLSYLFISHDLAVVRYIADDVIVMRNGRIVEQGNAIWTAPTTDYARALIAAAA